MRHEVRPAAIAAFVVSALALVGAGTGTASATQNVDIGPGLAFTPSTVTVLPGESVVWTFQAAFHSTTSNATSGPEFWDSGIGDVAGQTFTHTFTTPGTYPYYCKVHSSPTGNMMNGVVIVAPATPTATPSPLATVTPTPTVTFTPSPLPTATSTPGGTGGPGGPGFEIPDLDFRGRALLALAVIAGAFFLLARRR
jgi:plastocyanin